MNAEHPLERFGEFLADLQIVLQETREVLRWATANLGKSARTEATPKKRGARAGVSALIAKLAGMVARRHTRHLTHLAKLASMGQKVDPAIAIRRGRHLTRLLKLVSMGGNKVDPEKARRRARHLTRLAIVYVAFAARAAINLRRSAGQMTKQFNDFSGQHQTPTKLSFPIKRQNQSDQDRARNSDRCTLIWWSLEALHGLPSH